MKRLTIHLVHGVIPLTLVFSLCFLFLLSQTTRAELGLHQIWSLRLEDGIRTFGNTWINEDGSREILLGLWDGTACIVCEDSSIAWRSPHIDGDITALRRIDFGDTTQPCIMVKADRLIIFRGENFDQSTTHQLSRYFQKINAIESLPIIEDDGSRRVVICGSSSFYYNDNEQSSLTGTGAIAVYDLLSDSVIAERNGFAAMSLALNEMENGESELLVGWKYSWSYARRMASSGVERCGISRFDVDLILVDSLCFYNYTGPAPFDGPSAYSSRVFWCEPVGEHPGRLLATYAVYLGGDSTDKRLMELDPATFEIYRDLQLPVQLSFAVILNQRSDRELFKYLIGYNEYKLYAVDLQQFTALGGANELEYCSGIGAANFDDDIDDELLLLTSPGIVLYDVDNIFTDTTDTLEWESNIPCSFLLYPPYPNPFNSTATIRFALPKPGSVHLEVFDPLGRRVRDLIPGSWVTAGEHSLILNGEGLSSGVYYLQLGEGKEVSRKAVSLVK